MPYDPRATLMATPWDPWCHSVTIRQHQNTWGSTWQPCKAIMLAKTVIFLHYEKDDIWISRPFLLCTLTNQADSRDKRQGGGASPTLEVSAWSVHRAQTSLHCNRQTDRQTDGRTDGSPPSIADA